MGENVTWLLEVNIKDGELGNFKELMNEMVDATQNNEPGTLNYEWFISEDEQSTQNFERYADSSAAMTHLVAFGERFAERFLSIVEPTRLGVYGNPSDEVRGVLAGFGAAYMSLIGGVPLMT